MGKPIIEHQGVAFMLAEMAIGVEAARGLVWRSAWMFDNKERNCERLRLRKNRIALMTTTAAFHASMAKAMASETAVRNANLGVQSGSIHPRAT